MYANPTLPLPLEQALPNVVSFETLGTKVEIFFLISQVGIYNLECGMKITLKTDTQIMMF